MHRKGLLLICFLTFLMGSCVFWNITANGEINFERFVISPDSMDFNIHDDYGFLSAGPNGLRIFDFKDPGKVMEIESFYQMGLDEILIRTFFWGDFAVALTDKKCYLLNIYDKTSITVFLVLNDTSLLSGLII